MRSVAALVVVMMLTMSLPATVGGAGADVEGGGVGVHAVPVPEGPVPMGNLETDVVDLAFQPPVVIAGLGGASGILSPGLPNINVPGLPRVPVKVVNLEYPAGTLVEEVRGTPSVARSIVIPGGLDTAPPSMAIGTGGPMGAAPVQTYYDGSRFPADWLAYEVHRGLDDASEATIFVNVFVYPVATEEVNGGLGHRISYIDSIDIEVVRSEPPSGPSSRDGARAEGYGLVIIGPKAFEEDLQRLADHKNDTGLETRVVLLDDIYNGKIFEVQGRDNPEKIKYFIKDAVEEWGTDYIIIGGDVDRVPTRQNEVMDGFDDDGSWYTDGKWVPSDNYYADLYDGSNQFSSWDDNGNGVFGQWASGGYAIDTPDFYLDVYIGRLSASTTSELDDMVDKVIGYETNTDWSWFFKAGLAGLDTFRGDPGEIPESEYGLDCIGDIIQPYGYTLIKMYETKGTLSATAINNAINSGVGIMTLSGHGSPDAWGSEVALYYSNGNIAGLNNGVKLPVGSQASCSTGAFDNEDGTHYPGWNNPESMAEEFTLRANGGHIADMGSSRVAYGAWGTDWTNYNAGYLNKMFYKALVEGQGTPGKMFSKARDDYMDQHGTVTFVGNYKHMASFNLFGDPSAALGGVGLTVTPGMAQAEVAPGGSADFNFTVKNVGVWQTGVSLSAEAKGGPWTVVVSSDTVDLAVGEEVEVNVTATAGSSAIADTKGQITLVARSVRNDRTAKGTATAVVKQIYGLGLKTDLDHKSSLPLGEVTFNITVVNKGNGDDGASLSYADMPQGWGAHLASSHVALTAFGTTVTTVTASVPEQVLAGSYWFNVSATLDGAAITKKVTLRVDIQPRHDISIGCQDCEVEVGPGESVDVTLDVGNMGNVVEDIVLSADGPDGWTASMDASGYIVAPYSTGEAVVTIDAYEKAVAGDYFVTVTASIPQKDVAVDIKVTVKRVHGLRMTVSKDRLVVEDGEEASFDAVIENTGNGPEEVKVSNLEVPEGWYAQGDPQGFTVPAYDTYRIDIIVTTVVDSLAGDYTVKMRAQGQEGPKVTGDVTVTVGIAERIDGTASLDASVQNAYPSTTTMNKAIFENHGNVIEPVSLSTTAGDGTLTVSYIERLFSVSPGGSEELSFTIAVSADALAGSHQYIILVVREKGETITLRGSVTVEQVYGFETRVEGDDEVPTVQRGDRLVRGITITNTGNGEDTFSISYYSDAGMWASMSDTEVTLGARMSKIVYVYIDPAENAAPEFHHVIVTIRSECGAEREEVVHYTIEAPEDVTTDANGAGTFAPWLILLLFVIAVGVIVAISVRNAAAGTRGRPAVEDYDEAEYLDDDD